MRKSTPKLRVRMLVDHDWPVPGKRAWIAFKADREYPVTQTQYDALVPVYAVRVDGNR